MGEKSLGDNIVITIMTTMDSPSRPGGDMAAALASICFLLAACQETPVAVESEKSVRPGVNDSYYGEPDVRVWVERFEREDREIYARRQEIASRVGVKAGMDVADIGSGTGLFTGLFSRAVGSTGKVYAVDLLPHFLEHVRKKILAEGWTNVVSHPCLERSVALPPNSIDLAFVCDTYHHLEYPRSTLASVHAALRPRGELVVIDFIRIEGKSREWILNHVRAGKETVIREVEDVGFKLVDDSQFLEENYFLRFRREG